MPKKICYGVSACLLGENCKYNGGNNLHEELVAFLADKEYIAICPEVLGGLPIPRESCEIIAEKVISQSGKDFTKEYVAGAKKALSMLQEKDVEYAILQARSPSCGCGKIYDGSFQKHLIDGDGVFVQMCRKAGICAMETNAFLASRKQGKQ